MLVLRWPGRRFLRAPPPPLNVEIAKSRADGNYFFLLCAEGGSFQASFCTDGCDSHGGVPGANSCLNICCGGEELFFVPAAAPQQGTLLVDWEVQGPSLLVQGGGPGLLGC